MTQPIGTHEAQVGRDDVAGPEQDDVARHEARPPATSSTTPSRRTRRSGPLASRSASSARSPRYSVTTSAPTIGRSASRTSRPSRTSPRSDGEDARRDEQEDERLGQRVPEQARGSMSAAPASSSFGPEAAARRRDLRSGQPDRRVHPERTVRPRRPAVHEPSRRRPGRRRARLIGRHHAHHGPTAVRSVA